MRADQRGGLILDVISVFAAYVITNVVFRKKPVGAVADFDTLQHGVGWGYSQLLGDFRRWQQCFQVRLAGSEEDAERFQVFIEGGVIVLRVC